MRRCCIIVILSLCVGCVTQRAELDEVVVSKLDDTAVQILYASMLRAGLHPERFHDPKTGWRISVNRDELTRAVDVLATLPSMSSGVAAAPQPIAKPGMLSSHEEQRLYREQALSQQLEETLARLPGVVSVRVHLNVGSRHAELAPRRDGDQKDESHYSGSVVLVMRADIGTALTQAEVAQIVSGATGIIPSQVSVVVMKQEFVGAPLPAHLPPIVPAVAPQLPQLEQVIEEKVVGTAASAKVQSSSAAATPSPMSWESLGLSIITILCGVSYCVVRSRRRIEEYYVAFATPPQQPFGVAMAMARQQERV